MSSRFPLAHIMSSTLDSGSLNGEDRLSRSSSDHATEQLVGRKSVRGGRTATTSVVGLKSKRRQAALKDILEGLRRWELWVTMGWYDVRKHYRRSVLGPFWLTLSMAIMVGALGFLYGGLFGQPLRDYLPYLALGLIFWTYLSSFMIEGSTVFTSAGLFIHQINAPLSIYPFRLLWKSLITLAHNLLVFLAVAVVFDIWPGMVGLLVVPALVLLSLAGLSVSVVLGLIASRFRDIPPIVVSLVQLLFFVSPILWKAEQAPVQKIFVDANPFFHLLNIVRQPLLGQIPAGSSWIIAGALAGGSSLLAAILFVRFRGRIAYWV